jgi:hypothetical protein
MHGATSSKCLIKKAGQLKGQVWSGHILVTKEIPSHFWNVIVDITSFEMTLKQKDLESLPFVKPQWLLIVPALTFKFPSKTSIPSPTTTVLLQFLITHS